MKLKVQQITVYSFFIITTLIAFTPLWNNADNFLYDNALKAREYFNPQEKAADIEYIELNQQTLKSLNLPQKERTFYKETVNAINSADFDASIYLPDFYSEIPFINKASVFSAASRKGWLFLFPAEASEKSGYCGVRNTVEEEAVLKINLLHPQFTHRGNVPEADYIAFPQILNLSNYTRTAVTDTVQDSDGITRKVPLLYHYGEGYLPSAALLSALKYFNADFHTISVNPGHWLTFNAANGKKVRIPVDETVSMLIPFTSTDPSRNRNQAESLDYIFDFLLASSAPELTGHVRKNFPRTVFIAESTLKSDNFTASPLQSVCTKTSCHFQAFNGIITESFIQYTPLWLKLIYVVFMATMLEVSALMKKDWQFNLTLALTFLAYTLCQAILWFGFSIKIWYFGMFFAFFISWMFSFATRRVNIVIPPKKEFLSGEDKIQLC